MKRRTHNNFARFYLSNDKSIKMKDIDRINGAIDSPSKMDKSFTHLFGLQEFDFAGLTEKGSHRNYNHDPVMGLTKAMAIDPVHGFDIYMAHIMMDKTSNILRESLGTDNRDISEVLFNRMLRSIVEGSRGPRNKDSLMYRRFQNKLRRNKFYRMNKK